MTLRPLLAVALAAAALAAGCGSSASPATPATATSSTNPPSTTPPGVPAPGGGGSGGDASAGAETTATVSIQNFKFTPATIKLKAGGTITWTNHDSALHTATATDDAFDTGTLKQGQSKTITLRKPGTYAYVCRFHKFMQGTVVVVR